MTPSLLRRLADADRRVAGRLRRRAGLASPHRSGDDGFALLETVVAISLIVLVMAAFSVFFVNTVAFTSLQRANQTATRLANSALESIRVLPASDVATKTSAALTLLAAPEQPKVIDGISYTRTVATAPCVVTTATLLNATCTNGPVGTGIAYTRVTVTVTWTGSKCPSTGCSYTTATLISSTNDPKFAPARPRRRNRS